MRRLGWQAGRVTLRVALGVALGLCCVLGFGVWCMLQRAPAVVPSVQPSLILVVIETLRADRLALYGHLRQTAPTLSLLAQEGVVFERASTAATWTLPAVSSLLTGLPPGAHGVRVYEDRLPSDVVTLAERLKGAGYHTAFLGVNSLFESGRQLEQGFDYYYGIDEIPGLQLNDQLYAWMRERPKDRPFFLYVHYFEPHCRYAPPPEKRDLYWPPNARHRTGRRMTEEQWRQMHECFQLHFNPGEPVLDVDYYLSAYDAEIRQVDYVLGLFLERLKEAGLYDQALLALTSDHGEEFYDHGGFGHGKILLEHNLHVPLILRLPGGEGAGGRVHTRVSSLDLAPTLLLAAGLEADARGLPGRPLLSLARGLEEAGPERAVFAETNYEGQQRAVLEGDWKLLRSPDGKRPEGLFNLESDPQEQQDLRAERPEVFEHLSRLLVEHERQTLKWGEKVPGSRQELTQEAVEKLRALGYTP